MHSSDIGTFAQGGRAMLMPRKGLPPATAGRGTGHFPVMSGTARTIRCSGLVRGRHPALPRLPSPTSNPMAGAGAKGAVGARDLSDMQFLLLAGELRTRAEKSWSEPQARTTWKPKR